jgi:hypothetical protein
VCGRRDGQGSYSILDRLRGANHTLVLGRRHWVDRDEAEGFHCRVPVEVGTQLESE